MQRLKLALKNQHLWKVISSNDSFPFFTYKTKQTVNPAFFNSLFPDLQVMASTKTETLTGDFAFSPTSLQTSQSPVKCCSLLHQPSPPTALPNGHKPPRQRRAASLNRPRPSLSNSSGKCCCRALYVCIVRIAAMKKWF